MNHKQLTEEQVIEISRLIMDRYVLSDIAQRYGVVTGTVSGIKNGRVWKHLFTMDDLKYMQSVGKAIYHKKNLPTSIIKHISKLILKGYSNLEIREHYPYLTSGYITGIRMGRVRAEAFSTKVLDAMKDTIRSNKKITETMVLDISRRILEYVPLVDIAKEFNVAPRTITTIKHGDIHSQLFSKYFLNKMVKIGGRARLTNDDVRCISKQLINGVPNVTIARRFYTKPGNVWCIKTGKTWSHLFDEETSKLMKG